jgi:DNA-binding PadR family transcriptional regulator
MSEPAVTIDVSPLALSILELLNERPMHPYELASTMRERHHDEFIRLNFGSLYHTVEVLERNGWIVPTEREKDGRRPERTVYRLTESGQSVFLSVLRDILAIPRREYLHFSAGLMFMHHLESKVAVDMLQKRSLVLGTVIDKLSHILDELHETGHTRLIVIELEHKIAILQAERAWVNKTVKEIDKGTLEWKAGIDAAGQKLRRKHGTGAH